MVRGGIGATRRWRLPTDTETEAAVVVCPQQKSGPTKVIEAGRINPCRRKVCSEPLRENGTAKVVDCARENSKHGRKHR